MVRTDEWMAFLALIKYMFFDSTFLCEYLPVELCFKMQNNL